MIGLLIVVSTFHGLRSFIKKDLFRVFCFAYSLECVFFFFHYSYRKKCDFDPCSEEEEITEADNGDDVPIFLPLFSLFLLLVRVLFLIFLSFLFLLLFPMPLLHSMVLLIPVVTLFAVVDLVVVDT